MVGVREDVLGTAVDPALFEARPARLAREVKQRFSLRPVEANLGPAGARRLAFANRVLRELHFLDDARFVSAWAHWDLVASGMLYRMLEGQREIGVIGSRGSVPGLIEAFLKVKVRFYQVPPMFADKQGPGVGGHYPRRFEQLRRDLQVAFPGMLFLVGAGICGKVYCQWIKERGGVAFALDVGAVMDTWIGLGSRPAVVSSRFKNSTTTGGVPEELLLNPEGIAKALGDVEPLGRHRAVQLESTIHKDLGGEDHEVRLVRQWDMEFYMLARARSWMRAVEDGSWEQEQRERFLTGLRERCSTIGIDIGANNGIYTLMMCREPTIRRVIAFEPCEPHFSLMSRSVVHGGFDKRCRLHRLACSDEVGEREMYLFPDETPSLNQLVDTRLTSDEELEQKGAWVERIQTVRLDDVVQFFDERIAIKIDAEGHESSVIRGARKTLENNDCFLQVESFGSDIVSLLEDIGYALIRRIRNDWYFEKQRDDNE